jgi:uncharacterized protein (DUF488 family)
VEIYTIGFTKKSAADFFGLLDRAGIQQLVDVRLNNVSQLAGFTKRDDLDYFMRTICQARYIHDPRLAPTQDMLDRYKKHGGKWSEYETEFLELMAERRVEDAIDPATFEPRTVLLCSEPTPDRCHRRLVVDYLASRWNDVSAVHL